MLKVVIILKSFILLICLSAGLSQDVFAQQVAPGLSSRPVNFTTFPDKALNENKTGKKGFAEVKSKRTVDSRYFISEKDPSLFSIEKATGAIHYKKNDQWQVIDHSLTKKSGDMYEATEQEEPVGFDIKKKRAYIKTVAGIVYFNSWQLIGKNDQKETVLASANWSNFTAGEDGIRIKDIFPGIDAEMRVFRGSIKTDFIISNNQFPGFESYVFRDLFETTTADAILQSAENNNATADFHIGQKRVLHIGNNFAFAESDPEHSFKNITYSINGQWLSFSIDAAYLDLHLKTGRVIIDPLVSAVTSTAVAGIQGSMNNGSASNTCTYPISVELPAAATFTDVLFKYAVYSRLPALNKNIFFTIKSGVCESASWTCNVSNPNNNCSSHGTVTTFGNFVSITNRMLPCLPQPSCAVQYANYELKLWNTYTGAASFCDTTYVGSYEPFVLSIEGRTVEVGSINASSTSVCSGAAVVLSAGGIYGVAPYTYSWDNNGGSGNSVIVTPTTTTTYTVTVRDKCNNTARRSIAVNIIPGNTPSPLITTNSPICENSTLQLSASLIAGATYSWTGPNGFTSTSRTPVINNATTAMAGMYSVTSKIGNCSSAPSLSNVVINPIPNIADIGFNFPVCTDSSLKLTATTISGATYSWTGPNGFTSAQQNPIINNINSSHAGVYFVSATAKNCSSVPRGTTVMVFNAIPTPVLGYNGPVCEGQTINLSATTVPGASYEWSGPNGYTNYDDQNPVIQTPTLANAGVYTLIESNTCRSAPATINVVVNPSPSITSVTSNSPVCKGDVINFGTNNITGASFAWTGTTGFTSNQQNASIPNSDVIHSGVYTVTATANNCPSLPKTVTVVVNEIPVIASVNNNGPVCEGTAINLTTPNIPGATFKWTGPNGFTSNVQNPVINDATIANEGQYIVVATVGTCVSAPGSTTVLIKPAPVVGAATGNSPLCGNGALSISVPDIAGASFSWTGPNGFTANSRNVFIQNVSKQIEGVYTVTATGGNSCISKPVNYTVAVGVLPLVDFTSSSTCLPNTSVQFTNTSSISEGTINLYEWNFGDAASGSSNTSAAISPLHIFSTAATYNIALTAASDKGCVATKTVAYNKFLRSPIADFSISDNTVCVNDNVVLMNRSNAVDGSLDEMSWTFGDGTDLEQTNILDPIQLTYNKQGSYNVKLSVTNTGGCKDDTVQTISVSPLPAINAGPDKYLFEGESRQLLITGESSDLSYEWSPSIYLNSTTVAEPTAVNILKDIQYVLKATSRGGCSATDTVFIKVLKPIIIPNVFSPNNDGVNDKWVIENLNTYPKATVEIFNRYGQMLYKSVGNYVPWDGTLNGKPLPVGVYFYIIGTGGLTEAYSGSITILR
ncbi:gliding motility-associated C-terminal domain-containing protein [Ferruginibacter sp. SUN002]|uniref:T9SS type B sorting domain-containing protein n=1 Tax=Ferruginibacter sp. SUN002 TaxID=2937789 RepID=UPI003D35B820